MSNSPAKRTPRLLLICGCGILAALSIYLGQRNHSRHQLPRETTSRLENKMVELSGNIDWADRFPGHREEIESYIERVRTENLETLIQNLNFHENLLVRIRSWSNDPSVELSFQVCIANRRLSRIHQELGKMGKGSAQKVARRIHRTRKDLFISDLSRCLDLWENDGGSNTPIPLGDNHTAMNASVVLLALHCPADEVLGAVDEWEQFAGSANERVSNNPALAVLESEVRSFSSPENMFLSNLYLWILHTRCGANIQMILEGLTPRLLRHSVVPFVGWDARLNSFDMPHVYAGAPVDRRTVLMEFDLCDSWVSGGVFSAEQKSAVVKRLRLKLNECLKRRQ